MHNSDENGFFDFSWIKLLIAKMLNYGFYWGLAGLYTLIVEISKSEILSTSAVSNFFGKVQLIIGIVMMFRLSVTILQGIVDPDKAADSQAGMGNIVVKVLTGLVLLAMLMPLSNMPAKGLNHYEDNVRKNGILFGTLYEVQARVLDQNIITKLVLNTKDNYEDKDMKNMGNIMAAAVLKTFFTPNLKASADTTVKVDQNGKYADKVLFCETQDDMDDGMKYSDYYKNNNPGEILDMIDQECGDYYAYNFNWLPALIVGALMCVILIALCIGVAKRAIKLAILRLIAPIPIISYMGSNTDINNSKLGNWIQMLVTTYVDLYITLAIIFFAVSIINDIAINGLKVGDGEASVMAKVFIYIGLLLFARESPKFIKQALGLKDDGGGLMGSVAAGLGMAALGGKKLAGGAYNKARGGSFREGFGAVNRDDGLKDMFNKKRELDKNNNALQVRKQQRRERADERKGNRWFEKNVDKNTKAFTGKEDDKSYEEAFGGKFGESAKKLDIAKNEYDAAASAYDDVLHDPNASADDRKAASQRYRDAQTGLEKAEKKHEDMRARYAKKARKEDRLRSVSKDRNNEIDKRNEQRSLPSTTDTTYRSENNIGGSTARSSISSSEPSSRPTMSNSNYTSEGLSGSTPQPTTEGSRYKSENRR